MGIEGLFLLALAGMLTGVSRRDVATVFTRSRLETTLWVFSIAAWPHIVTYLVAPLVFPGLDGPDAAGSQFPLMQYLPAMAMSMWALARGVTSPSFRIDPAGLVTATVLGMSFVWVILDGSLQIINLMVAAVLIVGTFVRRQRVSLDAVASAARISLIVTVIAVASATVVNPSGTIDACRADKCNIAAQVLTSPFAGNGNIAGLAVVVLLPFTLIRLDAWRTVAVCIGAAAFLESAGSRTSLIGLGFALVLALGMQVYRSTSQRTVLAATALAFAFAISLFPMFANYLSASFAFRGQLWAVAKQLVIDHPLLGWGPTYWQTAGQSALYEANYSPHNGWLDMVVGIGVLGCAGVVCIVVVQVVTTTRTAAPYLLGYYAVILSMSTLESIYVPYYLGILPSAAILPLIVYAPGRKFRGRATARRPIRDAELTSRGGS